MTSDDEPSSRVTPLILGMLREYNVKGSFCHVGMLPGVSTSSNELPRQVTRYVLMVMLIDFLYRPYIIRLLWEPLGVGISYALRFVLILVQDLNNIGSCLGDFNIGFYGLLLRGGTYRF